MDILKFENPSLIHQPRQRRCQHWWQYGLAEGGCTFVETTALTRGLTILQLACFLASRQGY